MWKRKFDRQLSGRRNAARMTDVGRLAAAETTMNEGLRVEGAENRPNV
jgi:hypothetical protein